MLKPVIQAVALALAIAVATILQPLQAEPASRNKKLPPKPMATDIPCLEVHRRAFVNL